MKPAAARVFMLAFVSGPIHAAIFPGTGCAIIDPAILRGDQLIREGRHLEAHNLFAAGLVQMEHEPGRMDNPAIPCVMDRLSMALIRMGQLIGARKWSVLALERSRNSTTPHPANALLVNNLAAIYLELGDFTAGERLAREALAVFSESPDHPDRQLALNTLAASYVYRGDYARAEPLFRQALFHIERTRGLKHVEAGLAATNLADIYRTQTRYSEAIPLYEKAMAAFKTLSRTSNWELMMARSGLMVSYEFSGRRAQASVLVATFEAAESSLTPNDVRLGRLLHDLALVRIHRKEFAPARAALERSLAIFESVYGPGSPHMIGPLLAYADVLRASKDKQSAKRTDSRIKALMESANPRQ